MEQDIENNEKAMSSRFGQLVQAAEQGDSEAQLMLGSLLCKKAEGEERTGYAEQLKGYIEAAQWFRRAAEQGNADACFELGFSYNYGEGVDQDYEEAVKWYKKAIDISGHGSALYHLGECYHYGHGVPKNEEEAKSLFRLVESKDGLLGLYYVYDGRGVRSWEKKRLEDAMNGNAEDQYYVGRWYEDHYDLKGSNEKAVEWYQKAAVQGLAEAQNSLGKCYEWGKDVAQDDKKAAELYRNAAEQGLADAQNNCQMLFFLEKA